VNLIKRRAKVAELTREGWTMVRLAAYFGVSQSAIVRDRKAMGVMSVHPLVVAERRTVVAELSAEGWTLDQLAALLDTTPRTISRDRDALGIKAPPHRPWTEDDERRARELLADGESLKEVARTLGRNVDTIGDRFRGQGWTPHEVGQYNKLRKLRRALDV
jgi:lambda repressor-like predicted transcriptional regulator